MWLLFIYEQKNGSKQYNKKIFPYMIQLFWLIPNSEMSLCQCVFHTMSYFVLIQHSSDGSPISFWYFVLDCLQPFCKFCWWYFLYVTRKYQWSVSQATRKTVFFLPKWSSNSLGEGWPKHAVVTVVSWATNKSQQTVHVQGVTTLATSLLLPGDKL